MRTIALAAAALAALPAAAAAQAPPYPSSARPHATVAVRSIDDLFVDQFRVQAAQAGRTLTARITLAAHRTTASALLFLPREGWTGATAGGDYGATILRPAGVTVRALSFDAVGTSATAVRPTQRIDVLADRPASVGLACTGTPGCAEQPFALAPGALKTLQRRPYLADAGPTAGMAGTLEGQPLFSATMPRPTR